MKIRLYMDRYQVRCGDEELGRVPERLGMRVGTSDDCRPPSTVYRHTIDDRPQTTDDHRPSSTVHRHSVDDRRPTKV